MKIKFPENLDLNSVFSPTSVILTEESQIKVLSDIAERNPSMTIAILNHKVSIFVYTNNDTEENPFNEVFVTIENAKWQIIYSTTYKAEVVEREFIRKDGLCFCIDTMQIK